VNLQKAVNFLRNIAIEIFFRLGFFHLLRKISNHGKYVLMFHGISKKRYSQIPQQIQPHLTTAEFHDILMWIKRHFKFLSVDEFFDDEKNGVLLTFDDGFANNFSNALPILEKFQAQAVFFVSTQHVEKTDDYLPSVRTSIEKYCKNKEIPKIIRDDIFVGLSIEKLKKCGEHTLITIGSHTVSHPFLTQCSESELRNELKNSKMFLEKNIGGEVNLFAYPTGDYDGIVVEEVKKSGYEAAFITEKNRNLGEFQYEIPRIGIYYSSPSYLAAKLCGLNGKPIKTSFNINHE